MGINQNKPNRHDIRLLINMQLLPSLYRKILSRKRLAWSILWTTGIPFVLFWFFASWVEPHPSVKFKILPLLVFICSAGILTALLSRNILASLHHLNQKAKEVYPSVFIEGKAADEIVLLSSCLEKVDQAFKDKEKEIKQVKSRLIAFNAVTMAVNQTLDVDQILNEVLGIILEVTDYDGGVIFLSNKEDNNPSIRVWKGEALESIWKFDQVESEGSPSKLTILEGIAQEAEKRKQIIFIPDLKDTQYRGELYRSHSGKIIDLYSRGIKTLSAVPLVAKGRVFGAIILLSLTPREPSLEENELLGAVGQQIGMTIDNINLLSGWTKKAQDLSNLLETSGIISASLDLNQVMEVLTRKVMNTLNAECCWTALLDQKKESLVWGTLLTSSKGGSLAENAPLQPLGLTRMGERLRGISDEPGKSKMIPLEQLPFHDKVIQTNRMVKIEKEDQMNSTEKQLFSLKKGRDAVLLPLSIGQRTLGVVGVEFEASGSPTFENLNLCKSIASQAAFAIENAQLYEDVKQKAEETSLLYQVAQRLSSILDGDELLEQILKVVVESFGYLNCALLLVDKEKRELFVKAAHGFSGDRINDLRIKIDSEGITGWVAKAGEPMVVGDVSLESRYIKGKEECKSEVAVPLKLKGEIIGVLDAESERFFAFGEKDVRVLSQLASQIAVVLENSRLFSEEKKRYLQLALINDVGRKVVSTLDLNRLLENTVEVIQLSLKYDNISLFLVDEPSGDLLLKTCCGKPGNIVAPGYRQKKGVGMVGKAAEWGKTILCNDVIDEPSYIPAIADTRSELAVPIKSGRVVVGVLDVESFSQNTFDHQDVAVLETIVDLLATAIKNTQLYEETRKRASRLELADQINRAISSTLDLESVFRIVSQELNKIMDYDRISMNFWYPQQHLFMAEMISSPKSNLQSVVAKSIPAAETSMYEVVCTQKPYYRKKLVLDHESKPMDRLIYAEGIRSYMLIPIRDSDKITAVLSLESSKEHGFEEEYIQLLNSIAGQLAIAMQNAKLFSDLEKAYQNLKDTQSHMIRIERFRALGEMASGVVHDFNNILASILGRVQLLLLKLKRGESSPTEETEASLKVIEKSVTDGARILARIRDFIQERSDRAFSPVDPHQLIEDSLEMTRTYWKDEAFLAGIQIEIKKEFSATGMIMGDAIELREVLTNLLLNAGDAMSKGGILTLMTHEDTEYVYLTVKDTGMGMTDEVQSKLFVPFFTTKGEEGTGLGLSLAFGIITRHKGEITVESTPGYGSSFTIRLPRSDRRKVEESEVNPGDEKAHILVIEDEENIREVLQEILTSAGHTVTQAENGEEGIELYQKHKADLVITDLGMPGMSGWDVADAIKTVDPLTPVILSTGWGVKLDHSVHNRETVDRIINKPFNMQQILSLIGELLAQRKTRHLEPGIYIPKQRS